MYKLCMNGIRISVNMSQWMNSCIFIYSLKTKSSIKLLLLVTFINISIIILLFFIPMQFFCLFISISIARPFLSLSLAFFLIEMDLSNLNYYRIIAQHYIWDGLQRPNDFRGDDDALVSACCDCKRWLYSNASLAMQFDVFPLPMYDILLQSLVAPFDELM